MSVWKFDNYRGNQGPHLSAKAAVLFCSCKERILRLWSSKGSSVVCGPLLHKVSWSVAWWFVCSDHITDLPSHFHCVYQYYRNINPGIYTFTVFCLSTLVQPEMLCDPLLCFRFFVSSGSKQRQRKTLWPRVESRLGVWQTAARFPHKYTQVG